MNLREAAQQALEALEMGCTDHDGNPVDLVGPAITALRAALAEDRYVVTGNEFHGAPPEPYANWGDAIAAMIDMGVIHGLRISALAEDVAEIGFGNMAKVVDSKESDHIAAAAKMVATIRQEVTVDPVAWMCSDESLCRLGYERFSRVCEGAWNIPVYTAPPKREPLTDEELFKLGAESHEDIAYARAIERAHRIGGEE